MAPLPRSARKGKTRREGGVRDGPKKIICTSRNIIFDAPACNHPASSKQGRAGMERKATCRNWKDRISALAQSTGRRTFLIDPECQDILRRDVPRALFPLFLGGKWVAIRRHPLGRLFFSSDQPGAGSFTFDGLPGDHKERSFFVFWRRDGDCLLRLIGLVRFIDPEGREIATRSLFRSPPADEVASFDIVRNEERAAAHSRISTALLPCCPRASTTQLTRSLPLPGPLGGRFALEKLYPRTETETITSNTENENAYHSDNFRRAVGALQGQHRQA